MRTPINPCRYAFLRADSRNKNTTRAVLCNQSFSEWFMTGFTTIHWDLQLFIDLNLWKLHGQYYPISLGLPIILIKLNGWLNPSFQHFNGEIMLNHPLAPITGPGFRTVHRSLTWHVWTEQIWQTQWIDVGQTKGTTGNLSDPEYGCSSKLPLPNWEKTQSPSQVSVFWFSGSFDILSMKTKKSDLLPQKKVRSCGKADGNSDKLSRFYLLVTKKYFKTNATLKEGTQIRLIYNLQYNL